MTAKLLLARESASNPDNQILAAAETQLSGMEFFGLIRQAEAPDVFAEYTNYEQLKRFRQAYIVHILDSVLCDRSIVAQNDKIVAAEESEEEQKTKGTRITLDNVFELAKEQEDGSNDEDSEEKDGDDMSQDDEDE